MKLKIQLTKYLEQEPKARERRQKDRALANVLLSNHPSLKDVSKEVLTGIVSEVLYLDRQWRLILSERNDLRGSDYDGKGFKEKKQLEQESQVDLGYESGFK